ncbi:FadR/GntR family transcriptional regulator [Pseudomonas huaxiensis]|uniref:FadR/GntR family transcriptional regulator n=1 Tax=Pseudomonas huaxiensis TaxID=2213017 RepID=UPI000DA662B2|nr:FadR/GntR family transcriptional regulator [Pseudomonas huaxiensis]
MSNNSTFSQPLRRRRSLAEELVAALTGQVRDGLLKPGERLPSEAQVMEHFGVSRTVVREAISRLQAAGQVETRHGIGSFVLESPSSGLFNIPSDTVMTLADVLAVMEFRISLEVESAALAAQRRTSEQLASLREALDGLNGLMASGSDSAGADFAFHLLIAEATGNRYFTDILGHLGAKVIPRARLNTRTYIRADDPRQYLERLEREHEQIYSAIASRDSESARAAMYLHLGNSRERLRQAYERGES